MPGYAVAFTGGSLQVQEHSQAEYNLYEAGGRGSQTNLKQGCPRHTADCVNNGNPHQKCADDSLYHDKNCLFTAIVIAGKTEQERCQQTIHCICLQIAVGSSYYIQVL